MTICRYFQQGNCRYGNRCRYEHVNPNLTSYGGNYVGTNHYYGGGNGMYHSSAGPNYRNYDFNYTAGGGVGSGNDRGGTSILRSKAGGQNNSLFGQSASNNSTFQTNSNFFSSNVPDPKPPIPQREVKEILQMIINEFSLWERSGQWPLSCFSLHKEQGCFPGLTDYSPEEIRWYMYQARASGNLEECLQVIKGIYDKTKLVKDQLTTPSAEVYELLTKLSRGEKMDPPPPPIWDQLSSSSSVFANPTGSNVIPQSPAASSFTFSLPNTVQQTDNKQNFPGVAMPQTNMFSNASPNSIFTNTSVTNSSPSIFGGATQVSVPSFSTPSSSGFSSSNTNHVQDSLIYTPLENLSEETLNAFKAPVFSMGSVPIQPPPKELCW